VRTLLSRKVDGIIVTGRRTDPRPPIAPDLPVPVVYVMTQTEDSGSPCLIPDDQQGGELGVRHLITGGRTRIAHVTGPDRFLSARQRAAGAQKALSEAGLEIATGHVGLTARTGPLPPAALHRRRSGLPDSGPRARPAQGACRVPAALRRPQPGTGTSRLPQPPNPGFPWSPSARRGTAPARSQVARSPRHARHPVTGQVGHEVRL
jgi:hypothetical protein